MIRPPAFHIAIFFLTGHLCWGTVPKAGQSTPEILVNMEKYKKVASLFQQAVIPSARISRHDAHLVCNNMMSLFVSTLSYPLFALRVLFVELVLSSFLPVLYLVHSPYRSATSCIWVCWISSCFGDLPQVFSSSVWFWINPEPQFSDLLSECTYHKS